MTYYPIENQLGVGPLTNIDTTKLWPLGMVVRGNDATLGGGEFIYLAGVAGTRVGSLVTWDPVNGTTTLSPNTANLAQPVAVAMSANNSSTTYGWYQVGGAAAIFKSAIKINPNVAIFLSSTAGQIQPTAASGKEILGARTVNAATVASATSTVNVLINRPHAQGQVV